MHDYARHLVASIAAQVLPARNNPLKSAIARQFLPYCVSRCADGRFILLNREYKPLGWPTRRRCRVHYDAPEFESMRVTLDAVLVDGLPEFTSDAGTFHYLYGRDGVEAPWRGLEWSNRYLSVLLPLLDAVSASREGAA